MSPSSNAAAPLWQRYISHVLAAFVALSFVGSGGAKLAGVQELVEHFAAWGYPGWFVYFVGVLEVAGGLLTLVPRTRIFGAVLLVLTMAAAVVTHLVHGETGEIVAPLVLGALCVAAGWFGR